MAATLFALSISAKLADPAAFSTVFSSFQLSLFGKELVASGVALSIVFAMETFIVVGLILPGSRRLAGVVGVTFIAAATVVFTLSLSHAGKTQQCGCGLGGVPEVFRHSPALYVAIRNLLLASLLWLAASQPKNSS